MKFRLAGERRNIMLEYVMLLGKDVMTFFSFNSIKGWVLLFISAVVLIIVGYLIKGIWGAIVTLLTGTFLFLYLKGLLPF